MQSLLKTLHPSRLHTFKEKLRVERKSPDFLQNLKALIIQENFIHKITQIRQTYISYKILTKLCKYIPKQELRTLIDNEDAFRETPLALACKLGNFLCAGLLTELGANVNHSYDDDREGDENYYIRTPLGNALFYLKSIPLEDVEDYVEDSDNIIAILLKHGADPNSQLWNNEGVIYESSLMIALNIGSCAIVSALLDYGAKIDIHRTFYSYRSWNALDVALDGGNTTTGIEKIIISRCDPCTLGKMLDITSLVNAIKSNIPEKIEIVLAFFIEHHPSPNLEDCARIASPILSYGHRNNEFLWIFLVLFPNMKNCKVKGCTLVSHALKKFGNMEAVEMIRNFDLTLFDLLTLHLYYRDIREL